MKKTVCDICNEPCDEIEYTIPMIEKWEAYNGGIKVCELDGNVVTKNINLCDAHKCKVASFIDSLKHEANKI